MILPKNSWNYNNNKIEKAEAITSLSAFPSNITFSENVRTFTFTPKLTNAGVKAYSVIQPFAYVPVGTEIRIQGQVANITLTASSTPTGNQFWTEATPVAPTAQYLERVAESIASTINQNLSFNNNYIVTLLNSQLAVTSKQYGSLYNVTSSTTNTSVIFRTDVLGTAFYESENYIDYSAFADLYIGETEYEDNADKYLFHFIDSYRIDSNTSEANVNPLIVGDYCEPILPYRNLVQANKVYMMDAGRFVDGSLYPQLDSFGNQKRLLKPYFFLYGDSYRYIVNGAQKKRTMGQTPIRWVQLGALNELNPYDITIYTWMPNNVKTFSWLTTQPVKEITYDSHEYLQCIVKKVTSNGNFYLSANVNFYDGTFTTVNKPLENYNGVWGNVSFDVSPTFWGIKNIETLNNKLVKDYTVRLYWDANGTLATSNAKTYKMDRLCYEENHNIIYLNQFGAWDSLEFNGQLQEDKSREITTLERNIPFNANTVDSINSEVKLNVDTKVNSEFSLETGLVSQEMIEYSKVLSKSSSVFIWDKELQSYRSIIITSIQNVYNTVLRGDSIGITFTYSVDNNTIKR
jgi:hypothetical protein